MVGLAENKATLGLSLAIISVCVCVEGGTVSYDAFSSDK